MNPSMIKKVLMAATVVVLVLMIIIAPRLIGTEKEFSSIPKVIVDYANNDIIIYVNSAIGDFRYSNITIFAENETIGWFNISSGNETYSLTLKIPSSIATGFYLKVGAYDGGTGYEYNCTVNVNLEEDKIEVRNYYDQEIYNSSPPFNDWMREVEK